jgi:glucose dehydrogenase
MKAVRVHNYGGPEVLRFEDAPRPTPGSGELLIKVHAASVNPIDWKVRAGYMKDYIPLPMPFIPGWDASGVVEVVGSGVTPARMLPLTVTALTRNTWWRRKQKRRSSRSPLTTCTQLRFLSGRLQHGGHYLTPLA